jgi:hypothetical protein
MVGSFELKEAGALGIWGLRRPIGGREGSAACC